MNLSNFIEDLIACCIVIGAVCFTILLTIITVVAIHDAWHYLTPK